MRSLANQPRSPYTRFTHFEQDKQADFSVVIKSRGKSQSPWRWEIYRAGHSKAVAQYPEFFSTVSAAKKAGERALAELFEKHHIL
jgi:hypothetical protein